MVDNKRSAMISFFFHSLNVLANLQLRRWDIKWEQIIYVNGRQKSIRQTTRTHARTHHSFAQEIRLSKNVGY